MGVLVDKVSEVLDIASEEIEDPPAFGTSFNTQFIMGMAKAKDSVKILLNIGAVLNSQEVTDLAEVASNGDGE